MNDVMPGSDGLGFLGILKKSSELWFGPRRVQLFAAGCACVGWVSELRADAGRTVSIVKIVSLSLSSCWKPKSQEGNKSFVPEPRESSVFRDSYACERLTHPYICIMYISRIRIMAILLLGCPDFSSGSSRWGWHCNSWLWYFDFLARLSQ